MSKTWFLKQGEAFHLMMGNEKVGSVLLKVYSLEVYVNFISVNEEHRRKGYGLSLLQRAEKYAQELRINRLRIAVRPENTPAINLYEKFGFKILTRGSFLMMVKTW